MITFLLVIDLYNIAWIPLDIVVKICTTNVINSTRMHAFKTVLLLELFGISADQLSTWTLIICLQSYNNVWDNKAHSPKIRP